MTFLAGENSTALLYLTTPLPILDKILDEYAPKIEIYNLTYPFTALIIHSSSEFSFEVFYSEKTSNYKVIRKKC